MADKEYKFPAFDDLPKVKDMPQGSTWGFFDKNGEKDEVGSKILLLLTITPISSFFQRSRVLKKFSQQ
ncbi:hypothetical protein A1F94_005899 [Pyrenophora tritici-repentis]|nr:hypothetical protein A1F94_005899 [Pyrenophora tritici-repentis]